MTEREIHYTEIIRVAYCDAWMVFNILPDLYQEEKAEGPRQLRQYVEELVSSGERDPKKIAIRALGLIREHVQIVRSRATIDVQGNHQRAFPMKRRLRSSTNFTDAQIPLDDA